jgi:hypothetical protein
MAHEPFDKRLTPARPDLAAERLRGKVQAERFVSGDPATVCVAAADIHPRPDDTSSWDTQALFGERAVVYDRKDGWVWLQLARDGYVGYARDRDVRLGAWRESTHRIAALRAPIFPKADLKSPLLGFLPLNAELTVRDVSGDYVALADEMWVSRRHVCEMTVMESDFVAVAERILGAPYVWGGKTPDGLDCSGLVQAALHACGLGCPRDTDMQEREWAGNRRDGDPLRRGDLVFWKGHVGVMRNETELLHANAHHMCTAIEPVAEAIARIAAKGIRVSSVVRPVWALA